jgi:hypothetical protein
MLKVKDTQDLLRDPNSRAILNSNDSALQAYRAKRNREQKITVVLQEWEDLKKRVEVLEQMLSSGK